MALSFTPTSRSDSFADILSTLMILVKGCRESGERYWAYMVMKPSQVSGFIEARQSGIFDLEDFGTIIEWGSGDHPPEDIQRRMKNDYGMRDDFEELLTKVLKQLS